MKVVLVQVDVIKIPFEVLIGGLLGLELISNSDDLDLVDFVVRLLVSV